MPYIPEKKEKAEEREPVQRRSILKERRLPLMALISCAALIFGTVNLIQYYGDLNSSRNTSRELQEIMEAEDPAEAAAAPTEEVPAEAAAAPEEEAPAKAAADQPSPVPAEASLHTPIPGAGKNADILQPVPYPDNRELRVSDRFRKLRSKGEYIVGWLTMDHLSEAVVLKDNTYFLNHDATGNRNSNGAIFLDEATGIITRPYTLILYGHNMKSGNMFGRLKRYKENAYYFNNRIISFDSMFEDGKYAVFAVMEFSTVPGTSAWYDLYSLRSERIDDRTQAIRRLEAKSIHGRVLDVQADDQLLLLVTCVDGEDERLLVAARRLRPGEKEDGLIYRQTGRDGELPYGS